MKSLRNSLRVMAIVLLFLVALNALAAGYRFITDPSGNGLGITTAYLKPSAPFHNFFIPGIVLFVVNGLLSCVVAVLALRKHKWYALLILLQGMVYVGWIAIQLTMVTAFHPLHAMIGGIGLVLMMIGRMLRREKVTTGLAWPEGHRLKRRSCTKQK